MRFPEFSKEWEICKVSDILDFYSTNSLAWEQLEYGAYGLKNLHYGLIHNGLSTCVDTKDAILPVIKQNCIPKNYTECQNGDVAFADASEDTNDVAKCVEFTDCHADKVVCGLHTIQGRDKGDKTVVGFKGYAFSSQAFRHQIRRLAQGTKIYSISSKNFSECNIGIPSKEEQTKIATLLKLIEQCILTQKKIIEKYESLIKGIRRNLLKFESSVRTCNLKDICKITTGKLDANAMEEDGVYPFFTCAENSFTINTYAFDTEALLVSGNGANVGYINYCNGKFNAYQRTYVLYDFSVNIHYVRYYMDAFLRQRIDQEKNVGNTPYIVLSTLADMKICIPSHARQLDVCRVIKALENKLTLEIDLYNSYRRVKDFLLRRMFI